MLNCSVLMGRLTADPELRYTSSNIAAVSFAIAVDRSYVKQGEDRQADFIDIVAWRSNAEFICKYFKKGQLIAVQGSIQTRSYTDKQGNKRKAFEIVVNSVSFAGSKNDSQGKEGPSDSPKAHHKDRPDPFESGGEPFEGNLLNDDLPF